MTRTRKTRWARRAALLAALVGMLGMATMAPASAQTAESGSAYAFGAELELVGEEVIRAAEAEVVAPPFTEDEDALVEIPADPLVTSGTASAYAEVSETADLESRIQNPDAQHELEGPYNALAEGIVEDLRLFPEAIEGDDLLTAGLVRGEAVGVCDGGTAVYSATSELVDLQLAGTPIPLDTPVSELVTAINTLLVETTLDQVVNIEYNVVTELDGGGIEVDALVVTVLDAIGDDPPSLVSIRLGHASVGPLTCPDGDGVDDGDPLRELNKTASAAEVAPGGEFDYTITVPNRGECTLTDVVVVDTITGPAGFEVISTEPQGNVDGGTVTFDVGTIEPNETVVLTIRVRVPDDAPDGATFDDTVTATGDCDGTPSEVTKDLPGIPTVRDDFEGPCNVEFSNKESTHDQVTPGQTFGWFVNVFNSGAEPCTGITVTDTLDDRVEFVSCTGGCDVDGQTVTWNVAELPGGSSTTLSVVVRALDDASGTLENTAVIDTDQGSSTTVTIRGPVIGDTSVPRDAQPPQRGPVGELPFEREETPAAPVAARGPADTLPRTGAAVPMAVAALLTAAGLGLAGVRRRLS